MNDDYTSWLNGNSLVVVHNAVGEQRTDDLLNIQLAAYLTAGNRYPCAADGKGWQREYLQIQGGFGCNLDAMQSQRMAALQAMPVEPWGFLSERLSTKLDGESREQVLQCLLAFKANAALTLRQLWWSECVKPGGATGSWQVRVELRVVLPDASIVSTELAFTTRATLDMQWLWAPLRAVDVLGGECFDARYQMDGKRVALIREGLGKSVLTKKAQYRCKVCTIAGGSA